MEVDGIIGVNPMKLKPSGGIADPALLSESKHASLAETGQGTRDIQGYNIFRKINVGGDWEKLNQSAVYAPPYTDETVGPDNTYFYYVTTVYGQCESDSSNNVHVDIYTGIDPQEAGGLAMYPNPAGNQVAFVSPSEIIAVCVSDYTGALVGKTETVGTRMFKMDTQTLEEGVYIVQVITVQGMVCRKLVIAR